MRRIAVCSLALAGAAATGAILISSPGCSDGVMSVCDGLCDCWQCSAAEYDECVDTAEDAVQSAEREGCPEAADAFLRCVDADVQCMADRNAAEPTRCEAEQDALATCGVRVPVLGPLCERGAKRIGECTGGLVEPALCAGPSRCTYACYAMVSCDALLSGSSRQLAECLQRCSAAPPGPAPSPR
ncbi:hypothetical protein WMF04_03180 [Sorangium sp. So ce260]|uniref:hypothetical protein n=1 Tax=Sorangium sp. So ce260 TaxID=3133291 RepID=UPI003F62BF86